MFKPKIEIENLVLYKNIREDILVEKAVNIAKYLKKRKHYDEVIEGYRFIQEELIKEHGKAQVKGIYWENHICSLVAGSVNSFSLLSENEDTSIQLEGIAEKELEIIKEIYTIRWDKIAKALKDKNNCVALMDTKVDEEAPRSEIKRALTAAQGKTGVEILEKYYREWGCGIFEKYSAFEWDEGLTGVNEPDPVRLKDLIGYEVQKDQLLDNVSAFMEGRPYNNMLLYGDKGTGKSSSIKALLNMYKGAKMRLISVPKEQVNVMPELIEKLSKRGYKFIIFIDDISFEENDTGYKSFKSSLEGNVRAQSKNTLICVTSNRRNLIKEVWKDRENQDDVSLNDSLQEKSSLADRFGLRITFSAPSKAEYLDIVKGIAKREKLDMNEEELCRKALEWEVRNGGRSGRTAKQFINNIRSKFFRE